ncbi:MAG: NYN domain-containing protein [Methylococcaceae bacterium]|nr:MAG: NYN domain-containing protein [Methylococcaceae bacterium]
MYYYDAPPLEQTIKKPLGGAQINLGDTDLSRRNKSLLAKLATMPFFALRLGELHFRGWHVKNGKLPEIDAQVTLAHADLQPNIQQKGVDMRIGLDIAALTLKKQVQIIVLVTGDSDFVPAMKFARREGTQLFLVHLGHDVKDALIHHADVVMHVELPPMET